MKRGTIATIDLAALKHNFSLIQTKLPNHPIIAMVKANAYGHGAIAVARALNQATAFGVATLTEALELREAAIEQEIILLAGFIDATEISLLIKHKLTAVIHSVQQVKILENPVNSVPLKVWIKIDTGMHRLGFLPEVFNEMHERLENCVNVQKPIGLMTHLATADWPHSQVTIQQLQKFSRLTKAYVGPKSVANSALILGDFPLTDANEWLRPGIMLYGVSPFSGVSGTDYGLQAVMTLKTKIIETKLIPLGEKVGYGCTWQAAEETLIGIASIGYGDGYPRSVKNGTPVLINGIRCSIVGRVSMDMIAIDLRSNPSTQVGDEVILWGKDLPIEEIALNADGFTYEMLSGITRRVEHHYEEGRS